MFQQVENDIRQFHERYLARMSPALGAGLVAYPEVAPLRRHRPFAEVERPLLVLDLGKCSVGKFAQLFVDALTDTLPACRRGHALEQLGLPNGAFLGYHPLQSVLKLRQSHGIEGQIQRSRR